MALNDIILPPWAKGDPHEFIRMHREVSEMNMFNLSLKPKALILTNFELCFSEDSKGSVWDSKQNHRSDWSSMYLAADFRYLLLTDCK